VDINHQKEQFSSNFVRVVAAVAGYALYKPEVDEDSVDWGIAAKGGIGSIYSPRLELQLKSTAGKVTLMGVILDKLRRIQLELAEPVYELAVKAYQARIPVICQGDLLKQGRSFVLQNPHHFTLDLDAWVG
jgi:hypothetical protein